MDYANEAKRTLSYYLRTVWREAGLNWDSDNQSEVNGIVDSLIEAVDRKHEDRLASIQHRLNDLEGYHN